MACTGAGRFTLPGDRGGPGGLRAGLLEGAWERVNSGVPAGLTTRPERYGGGQPRAETRSWWRTEPGSLPACSITPFWVSSSRIPAVS